MIGDFRVLNGDEDEVQKVLGSYSRDYPHREPTVVNIHPDGEDSTEKILL